MAYQLSSGARRGICVHEPRDLYRAFYELIEFDGGEPADDMIVFPVEGPHRTVFINKSALDYVMLPAHQFVAGRTESEAEELDALEAATSRRKSAGGRVAVDDDADTE